MPGDLNLATSNLARSISFYSALLNAPPAKLQLAYTLFITEEPGLELALDVEASFVPTTDAPKLNLCGECKRR